VPGRVRVSARRSRRGRRSYGGDGEGGFTLVELLIALVLIAIISVLMFSGLRLGSRAWEGVETVSDRVSDLRVARNFIERTLRQAQQRSLIDPLIEGFNGANPDLTCERRDASTVPTQAFTLLNGELSHDLALEMATRIEKEADSVETQIERAFERAGGFVMRSS